MKTLGVLALTEVIAIVICLMESNNAILSLLIPIAVSVIAISVIVYVSRNKK